MATRPRPLASPDVSRGRDDSGEVTLRRARAEDADVVAAILDAGLADKFRPAFGRRSLDAVRAFVRADIRAQPERRIVAEAGGEVIGTACLSIAGSPPPSLVGPVRREVGRLVALRALLVLGALGVRRMEPGDAFVEELAVAAGARGLGVGRRLMERCEHDARRAGCRRLCLNVTSDNAPARALYERCGLTVSERERWYVRRLLFRAPASLVMRKRLA